MTRLDQAIANSRAHLLALRHPEGHWEGELSSSALATATALVALQLVDAQTHAAYLNAGTTWLVRHQNSDGGWGDTTISKSNLSTTLLVWSALGLVAPEQREASARCESWIMGVIGSLEPKAIVKAVVARYGKDKTFSVPILMLATLCGRLGSNAWPLVLALPFELAVLPRAWFGIVGLPVVSYALPALIAIGHARFHHAPPAKWSPLYWLRKWAWQRVSPMLATLQPSSGGYLEATPLTSFVTMALAGAGEKKHACVPLAVEFLRRSMREDGSWPIDTNLATWGTTLAIKALGDDLPKEERQSLKQWLLDQQYKTVHPFTNASPGGWAWTDLPGGVPDADDTSGALIALWHLCDSDEERAAHVASANAGARWLFDLQNNDGGMPTFCHGWGALPFDRSTPEITAHTLWAWSLWSRSLPYKLWDEWTLSAVDEAMRYLDKARARLPGGSAWEPLWFGNEHAPGEMNYVYGTAQTLHGLLLSGAAPTVPMMAEGFAWLMTQQHANGGWGGAEESQASIEETAVTIQALALLGSNEARQAIERGIQWLLTATKDGTQFPTTPIGLYFARLWYHEQLYPVIWTLAALKAAAGVRA